MRLEDFNQKVLEKIYHNEFSKIPLSKSQATIYKGGVDMKFNSYGFRSPEFIRDVDFLFSGCSVTEGWGIPFEHVWFNRLIKDVEGTHASVAKAGDSINGQIRKIFAYINKYGNPKNIVCLFPQFDRIQVFVNKELFATEPFFRAYQQNIFDSAIEDVANNYFGAEYINALYIDASVALTTTTQNKKEYFKRPLLAEETIPTEMSHMYSSQSIHMLSQYCKDSNINLTWSTWDYGTGKIINKMKYNGFFDEYLDMHDTSWNYDSSLKKDFYLDAEGNQISCHKDNEYDPAFNLGLDVQNGVHNAHFGSHRHLHYYESFLKKIKELE